MLNLGPLKSFLLISYNGNNENPPITDEICWSLDVRYSEAQLYKYFGPQKHFHSYLYVGNSENLGLKNNFGQSLEIRYSGVKLYVNRVW